MGLSPSDMRQLFFADPYSTGTDRQTERQHMKILLCHNHYQQPGGEDQVFADKGWLLESHGHEVARFTLHNESLDRMSRLGTAWRTVWNHQTYVRLRALIRRDRPGVLHCTNTFPLISPAAYYAARHEKVPVVQSLHNYRLLCPAANLLRDGRPCEDCVGRPVPWPAVAHGCYRQRRAVTAVVAGMLTVHRLLGTWSRAVDRYIALSEFSRRKFIEAGLPAGKVALKPNFVHPDPGPGQGAGGYAAFVGRLSQEKGIDCLLAAWSRLPGPLRLRIAGDGPLAARVREAARVDPHRVARLAKPGGDRRPGGRCGLRGRAVDRLRDVRPGRHRGIRSRDPGDRFAAGRTPAELVDDGRTGLCFAPGDAADLAAKVQQFLVAGPAAAMRRAARCEYETKYTAKAQLPHVDASLPRHGGIPMNPHFTVSWPAKYNVFGVGVSATTYDEASRAVLDAARQGVPAVVSFHAAHAIVTASDNPQLRRTVNRFEIVAPDGQPVRWALNLLHHTRLLERVYGPQFMLRLCERAPSKESRSICTAVRPRRSTP